MGAINLLLKFWTSSARAVLLSTMLLAAVMSWQSTSAQDRTEEYELKAVLLNRLMTFVTWPQNDESGGDDFCVVGSNFFGSTLDAAFSGNDSRVSFVESVSGGISHCKAIFISESQIRDFQRWLDLASTQAILTISDIPRFAENGGMIKLSFENRRVRFTINKNVADAADLNLSYQLLNLSDIVETQSDGVSR